jgi:O-antigen ligase
LRLLELNFLFSLMSEQIKPIRNYLDIILIWGGLACMVIGFLSNRVVANCGFLLVGIHVIIHFNRQKELSKYAWWLTWLSLALLPLLSDFLIEGLEFTQHRGAMKLILILLPLFVFTWKPNSKSISMTNLFVIAAMLFSSIYSIVLFTINYKEVINQYGFSKVMTVLSYGDHIRISWVVVISCILAIYEYQKRENIKVRFLLGLYILFQVVFLHWLGAKTGLLMLYMSVGVGIIYTLGKSRILYAMIFLPLIVLCPVIAYKTIPSFKQRINFIKYDYEYYSAGNYMEGLSDGIRYFSLKAGKELIVERPIIGHGFSRLQPKVNQWYADNIPHMKPSNYFLPSSEFVIYWASGGVLGLIAILAHALIPFFTKRLRQNIWFMAFFIPAVFSFTFETHLEGLLPLWVYGFFGAWFWYLSHDENERSLTTTHLG